MTFKLVSVFSGEILQENIDTREYAVELQRREGGIIVRED